ncbi:hypothetical protein M426DRAFT_226323 [Hypoxylon sp. CI-4A]|nr:hypothetical protein M426DRAFT_226323 [Hypoxylon sp. CI-4A]
MAPSKTFEEFDFIIVGAGISGINCAYRIQTELPHARYVILEGRNEVGGTWSLFTYPGVRSDSAMYTLGFSWDPYPNGVPIADGRLIRHYIESVASKHHISDHLRLRHKVVNADWSSQSQSWSVVADHDGEQKSFTAGWLVMASGYYDYETPLQTTIPGLDNFKGKIIHPQFWPKDYDYENKKLALIGSGATAISVLPPLAQKAAQVTMIQRSPTYIVSQDNYAWAHKYLPQFLFNALQRWNYMTTPYLFVLFCDYFPNAARNLLKDVTSKQLPKWIEHDVHFKPRYNPWEQRLCADPDARFYKSLHRPNVKLITGTIDTVTDGAIRTKDGQTGDLETTDVDAIITATGLNMKLGGGIQLRVDGETISWSKRLIWNGSMIEGIPNMMFMFGYTNDAWTLGADDTAVLLTRLWRHMDQNSIRSTVPELPKEDRPADTVRMWQLSSTYSALAQDRLPVYGTTGPWRSRTQPPIDYLRARWGDYTSGLKFTT